MAKRSAGLIRAVHSVMTKGNCMHERYEEMCALATIGELPEDEITELQEHLVVCDSCQQLYREFCQISADYLGSLAAEGVSESNRVESNPDVEKMLSMCLARAQGTAQVCDSSPIISETRSAKQFFSPLATFARGRRFSYCMTAFALCAVGLAGYAIRQHQVQGEVSNLRGRLSQIASLNANPTPMALPHRETTGRITPGSARLSEELKDVSATNARLFREKRRIEEELASATARLEELNAEARSYQNQRQEESAARAGLRARLSDAQDRLSSEEQTVADLEQKLRLKEEEVSELAAKEPPSVSDDEAKRLFAARDLHIVDVYDVDGHGKTRQSFGRVYYVEKKLLLFYAFDLEDRKHNRAAAAFQAWGYREANAGSPQSLGLFYVDDASLNRWVLKVNNPRVLEHVDVVFVTLEPPQGSSSPKGRRLLYANLGGAPNHP